MEVIQQLIETSGLYNLTIQNIIMLIIACVFLYLGIKRGYEPYLMVPIAFGMLLVNLPLAGLMDAPTENWTWWTLVLLISRNKPWYLSTDDFPLLRGLNRLWTATCKSKDHLAWWGGSIRYFRRILPFSNVGNDTARSCFSRDYRWCGWTNSLVLNDKTCTAPITSNCPSSVLIHGTCANY